MPDGSEKSHRLDGVTILGSAVFLGETTMGGARVSGDGGFSVTEFGAVGDGTTDDSAAFQKALNATTSTQPRLQVPAGSYKITTGLSCGTPNLELVGTGGAGESSSVGNGATQILVGSGIVGFTYTPSGASESFRGPILRNLHFRDNASGAATGGILLSRAANFFCENVVVSDFSGASSYGVRIDGESSYSQYGTFLHCGFHDSKIGCDVFRAAGGHRFVSCYFCGHSTGVGPTAGSIGLRVRDLAGNHGEARVVMTNFEGYETCVQLGANSENTELVGCRFENYTTGIDNAADFTRVIGGSFNNAINGSGGVSITNQATASRTAFMGCHVTATGDIADSGTLSLFSTYQYGFRPAAGASVACLPKAGIPADGDFTSTPVSGMLAVDTTNSRLYVRVGSTWKSVTVA